MATSSDITARLTLFCGPEPHLAAHERLMETCKESGTPFHFASSAATPVDIQLMVKQGYGLALIKQLSPLASTNWLVSMPGMKRSRVSASSYQEY